MIFESIFSTYDKCNKYQLQDEVKEYLHYVEDEPFYISPNFERIKLDTKMSTLKPKFVLFSAPGATGKTTLAKYISYRYNGIYWNLSKMKLGTNSFAGSLLNAVGPSNYSKFIGDLNLEKALMVIDAFDEAEIISGRKMISDFICDINKNLENPEKPSIILLARTETAQFIASFCTENEIALQHYEIGFFEEPQAKEFIKENVKLEKHDFTPADEECVNEYYQVVRQNITDEELDTFLGYAPVLQAISQHIITSKNQAKLISELKTKQNCSIDIIIKIMDDLLNREKEKVKEAFIKKIKDSYPDFDKFELLYTKEEQLVRVVYYILMNDTHYRNFEIKDIPSQIIDEYQEVLDTFLPQHPFVSKNFKKDSSNITEVNFNGPAFRDYTLATLLLQEKYLDLAYMYFEEAKKSLHVISQIFFDCYISLSPEGISLEHISQLYDSYRAKATALEKTYLEISETSSDEEPQYLAVFGRSGKDEETEELKFKVNVGDNVLHLDCLSNVVLDIPSLILEVGDTKGEARIYNSSIICNQLVWKSDYVSIESYPPNGCLIVSKENIGGGYPNIEINGGIDLKFDCPNISEFYKLVQYSYNFESDSDDSILKFTYALRNILLEFRTHKKDTLAKDAERINNVTVGDNPLKKSIFEYLKEKEIVYRDGHLYKIDTNKMQKIEINHVALARMDLEKMKTAFNEYKKWKGNLQ
ncbi:MAG: hypothetical protein ACI4LO_02030 [Anaerovoracaceae bacterium]